MVHNVHVHFFIHTVRALTAIHVDNIDTIQKLLLQPSFAM